MPLVNIKVIENVFSKEEKQLMIEKVTQALVSIEGEAMRSVTWVCVEDVKEGDWGIGGKTLRANDVHALQLGESAA
jgi:4-oxalocrotonate tautomerase